MTLSDKIDKRVRTYFFRSFFMEQNHSNIVK